MCRSLGPQWGSSDAFPGKADAPVRKVAPAASKLGRLPDMATPPRLLPPSSTAADDPYQSSNQAARHPVPPDDHKSQANAPPRAAMEHQDERKTQLVAIHVCTELAIP